MRTNDAAGNAGSRSFDIEVGRVTPGGSTNTPVAVPLTPASTIMPAMIDFPATFRLGTVTSKITRATFARRGVTVPVACTGAMDGSLKLTVSSATKRQLRLSSATLDSGDARCYGPHTVKVTLKPSSALAKSLARKGGPKSVKLTLAVQMRDWGKPASTVRRTITLKR